MSTFTAEFRRRETPATPAGHREPATIGVPVQPNFDTANKLPVLTEDGYTSSRPYGKAGPGRRDTGNDWGGHVQLNQEITRYREGTITMSVSGGTFTVDVKQANIYVVTLTGTATLYLSAAGDVPTGEEARPLSHDLVLILLRSAGASVTWDSKIKWPEGTAPTLQTDTSSVDRISLQTYDGGVSWLGAQAGLNFS